MTDFPIDFGSTSRAYVRSREATLDSDLRHIDMAQLEQLGELHDAGVLSDEEFAAAKAKVLGG